MNETPVLNFIDTKVGKIDFKIPMSKTQPNVTTIPADITIIDRILAIIKSDNTLLFYLL
jgi:hypothetical protein